MKKIDILLKVLILIGWFITLKAISIYQTDSSDRGIQIAFAIATATGVTLLLRYLFLTTPKEIMKDINALTIACWGVLTIFSLLMALEKNWWIATAIWHLINSVAILLSMVRIPKYKLSIGSLH